MFAHLFSDRATKLLFALLVLFAAIYVAPYLVNQNYLVAVATGDDSLHGYLASANYPERFKDDIFQFAAVGHVGATLMNYGGLWLIRSVGVPVELVHSFMMMVQVLGLPIIFVGLLWKKSSPSERALTFLLSAPSGFIAWNLANYSDIAVPYAASLGLPVLWLGVWMIAHNRISGHLVLGLGALIHPTLGLQMITTTFFLSLFIFRTKGKVNFLLLIIPFLCAVVPTLMTYLKDFPHISTEDHWRVLEFNMHATPWEAVFNWYQSFPTVVALAALGWVTYPKWRALGERYRKLIVAAICSCLVFSASHLLAHVFKIPQLAQMMGLRSPGLVASFLFPILILFFVDGLKNGLFLIRFLTAFIILQMVLGRTYGLDKAPILLLGASLWVHSKGGFRTLSLKQTTWILTALTAAWFLALFFYAPPKPDPFSAERITAPWTLFDYFRVNALIDFGPQLTLQKKIMAVVLAGLIAAWPSFNRRYKGLPEYLKWSPVFLMSLPLFVIFCSVSYRHHSEFSAKSSRDMYDAQIWARDHTDPDSSFMGINTAWRGISERPLHALMPQRNYHYHPDQRIKDADDRLLSLYGLEEEFQTFNQRQWYFVSRFTYERAFKTLIDFFKLAKYVGARYLIEHRKLNLPTAYSNDTYYIYDLALPQEKTT
jgi:hypothetical protein